MIFGNPSQNEAVRYRSGSCLILAGPGSGKTFVLTGHILFLIREAGVPPEKIAAFTFSSAAAAQMKNRFRRLSEGRYPAVTFSTVHAFFYRFLSSFSDKPPRIIPEDLRRTFFTLQFTAFGNGLDEETFLKTPAFRSAYQDFLSERNLTDFDRILNDSLLLIRSDPSALEKLKERFTHILIDEFQDISPIQFRLIESMNSPDTFYYAVGDDDQGIYGFRGAGPDVFPRFINAHDECRVFRLQVNYRSVPAIGRASSLLIRQNRNRMKKKHLCVRKPSMQLRKPDGSDALPFSLSSYESAEDECRQMAFYLEQIRNRYPESRSAILFRTHYEARKYIPVLEREGIPVSGGFFKTSGGSSGDPACLRAEQVILDYFRCACEADAGMLKREHFFGIMNCPERFLPRSLFPDPEAAPETLIRNAPREPYSREALLTLLTDLKRLFLLSPENALQYLLKAVCPEKELFGDLRPPARPGKEDFFKALRKTAVAAGSLSEFLRIYDAYGQEAANTPSESDQGLPRVMTMHQSKGLEFDCVFLPGLNEGTIPVRSAADSAGLEEERRILYVAMTRAREYLFLSYVEGNGKHRVPKSRFLDVFLSPEHCPERANRH